MQVDYLIVGQGISGTMLSWFLHKEGKTFLVIDDDDTGAASKLAAGIINPVTGRRYAYTWMIDELMSFALETYASMGEYLNSKFIFEKTIIDFFPSAQMLNAFVDRLNENDSYLHSYPDQNHFNRHFHYEFGCGEIRPAYLVQLQPLLASWRNKLHELKSIRTEGFDLNELKMGGDVISYRDISMERIIFCDGAKGGSNPWFELLPYAPNKGEALIIECEDLNDEHIFKKGLTLVPASVQNVFWFGSNYQWEFENDEPSGAFYKHATNVLNSWLKRPYRVLFHKAAVRPATLERRPFVGFHPQFKNIGILNGMGTKGSSLAPFFANQMVQHLIHGFPIAAEADVKRFTRILSK